SSEPRLRPIRSRPGSHSLRSTGPSRRSISPSASRTGAMISTSSAMTDRPCVLGVWLAFLLVSLSPALAADGASDQVRLAAMLRQLDSIDRLAELGASRAPQSDTRYHFDYARLRQDIER